MDRRTAVFPGGWGDRLSLALMTALPPPDDPIPSIEIVWARKEEHRGMRVVRGSFGSPLVAMLPDGAGVVPVELVEPARRSDRLVLLMPAWNDHGFATRRRLAVELAARGVASLSFDVPFYGQRRSRPEPLPAIATVADFALMGYGAVVEARCLLATLASGATVGVSGFSMGGNLAALVSTTLPFPLATAPLAASHSPGPVYLDGVIARRISWPALGGRGVAAELRAVLGSATALDRPPLPHHASAVIVGATSDGFVPRAATEALAAHWPGAELRWITGGHATLAWRHRPELADAVVASFDRLAP